MAIVVVVVVSNVFSVLVIIVVILIVVLLECVVVVVVVVEIVVAVVVVAIVPVVVVVYTEAGLESAVRCSEVLYSGGSGDQLALLSATELESMFSNATSCQLVLDPETTLFDVVMKAHCFRDESDYFFHIYSPFSCVCCSSSSHQQLLSLYLVGAAAHRYQNFPSIFYWVQAAVHPVKNRGKVLLMV